jgi:hypothetical protein
MVMIKNIDETKALIRKYKGIKLSQIKVEAEKHKDFKFVVESLTGFGDKQTCTLCVAVRGHCSICIHSLNKRNFGVNYCLGTKSFEQLKHAETPELLLEAFKKRARFLQSLIRKSGEV